MLFNRSFTYLFGSAGFAFATTLALTFAMPMSGPGTFEFVPSRYPITLAALEHPHENGAVMLSLRQQAHAALANLQASAPSALCPRVSPARIGLLTEADCPTARGPSD